MAVKITVLYWGCMKKFFIYFIPALAALLLIFTGGIYYDNHKSKSDRIEKQRDLRALKDAKLKYAVFSERAEKAKKRGDHFAAKREFLQAIEVLEADFEKTQSKSVAAFIFDILNLPQIGVNEPEKQLYYARNMDTKSLERVADTITLILRKNPSVLNLDNLNFLCRVNATSIESQDLKVIVNILPVLNYAQEQGIKIESCAGQTYESLTDQIIGIPPDNLTRLGDDDLSVVMTYANFELSGPKREDYFETYLPVFLNRQSYTPGLSRNLISVLNRFGNRSQRKQVLNILKKTEPKTGYHYSVMGQYYRSRYLDMPDYEMSRDMYQKSIDMGYRDAWAVLSLFHMRYLGLGGPVDKASAKDVLQIALDQENPDAQVIHMCLALKTKTKRPLDRKTVEAFDRLTWTVNGRALKAFAVYWGLIDDMSAIDAAHLMEDAALDGSDWGVAGMAVFNETGFGIGQNMELAKIWREQIGQSQEDIPVLNLPIEECEPQMGL